MDRPARTNTPTERTDRAVLWLLLALGTALMLLAAGTAHGEQTASRTDRISATVAPGATIRIENVSGDLVARPGREFAAVAKVSVTAPTRRRAEEILASVRLLQSRRGNDFAIETEWPQSRGLLDRRNRGLFYRDRSGRRYAPRCADCRIDADFDLTIPPGVTAVLETVNGDVRVRDVDGSLRLVTVNGHAEALGVRRSLAAETVNGNVSADVLELARDAAFDLGTVNGSVRLTLPKDAGFELDASTLHGSIASTFPLPRRAEDPEDVLVRRRAHQEKRPVRRIVVGESREDGEAVDLRELERELERSMRDVEAEIREAVRDSVRDGVRDGVRGGVEGGARGLRGLRIVDPRRVYSTRVGEGGARVKLSALNGNLLLLARGTRPEDAQPVVSRRRSFVVTGPAIKIDVPEIEVNVPAVKVDVPAVKVDVPAVQVEVPPVRVNVPPVRVRVPEVRVVVPPLVDASPVVRGDVAGDFLATRGSGSYRIGRVSGRVKILTHAGEIVVASAGADSDLKTLGGDIRLGPVKGNLAAQTLAGDVRVEDVDGFARIETWGGDIRVGRVGQRLHAKTGGGDIVVPVVGGSVTAETAGGDVRLAVTSRQLREGVSIRSGGGDVTLTLPSDFRGEVDLTVTGAQPFERVIRSEFPEVAVSRVNGTVRGTGQLNGGGERVRVETSSGAILLKRGPAAQR